MFTNTMRGSDCLLISYIYCTIRCIIPSDRGSMMRIPNMHALQSVLN